MLPRSVRVKTRFLRRRKKPFLGRGGGGVGGVEVFAEAFVDASVVAGEDGDGDGDGEDEDGFG
jgi:hypothetical protein